MVKNPNHQEADQVAICKAWPRIWTRDYWETNPTGGRVEDLNPAPADYNTSALNNLATLSPHKLSFSIYIQLNLSNTDTEGAEQSARITVERFPMYRGHSKGSIDGIKCSLSQNWPKQVFEVHLKWYYDQISTPWFFWAYHIEFHERMKTPFTIYKYLH